MDNGGDNQNITSTPIASPKDVNNGEQGEPSGGPDSAVVEGDKIQLVSTTESPKWPRLVERMDECAHGPTSKMASGVSPILAVVANNVALLASIFSSNETHKFYSIVFYLLVVSLVIASSLILGVQPILWYYKKRAAGISGPVQDAAAQESGDGAEVVRFDSLPGVEGRRSRMARLSRSPKRHYWSKIVTAKFFRSVLAHLLLICSVSILVFHLLGKSKIGN